MALDFTLGVAAGAIVGALAVLFFYSQRVTSLAHQKAEKIAQERFILLQSSLEESFRQKYEALMGAWRSTELSAAIKDARANALQQSRVTLKGKIGEQLAPLLPEFLANFEPEDARFIGSPIDFVIFKNLSKVEGEPKTADQVEVFIIDVKTGNATLTRAERLIKEAVERGAVKFMTMRLHETDQNPEQQPAQPAQPETTTPSSPEEDT